MKKFTKGESVCISLESLYRNITNLNSGHIDFTEDNGCEYYDLYNDNGVLVCMDGEVCIIEDISEDVFTLSNNTGIQEEYFTLTVEEIGIAVFR